MNPLDALTKTEHATAVIAGVAIGLSLLAPCAYGLYRFDSWLNQRRRAKSMRNHPAGKARVVESEVEFEATARKFLRRAS